MKKLLFTAFALFIFARWLPAQELDNYILSNYEGRRFQLGFMENEYKIISYGIELKIFISARQVSNINVTFPKRPPMSFRIPPDSVLVIPVSSEYYNPLSEQKFTNAIKIDADFPILVYAFSSQPKTSDSYAAIPVENWGKEYVAISMPNDQYNDKIESLQDSIEYLTPRQSEFMIVADYDDTQITIIPTNETEKGRPKSMPFNVTLNSGDTYLVKSAKTGVGTGDLSGSTVRSTKPVGVLSGHSRSAVPVGQPQGHDSKDHLVEMLLPTNVWGKKYISAPFGVKETGDFFKITSIQPNTKVSYQTDLNPVEFTIPSVDKWRFISDISKAAVWQADKPIQIGQFMPSASKYDPDWFFDPSLVLLPPVEQYVQRVVFFTPGGVFGNPTQYTHHYVTLIYEAAAKPFIKLDEELVDTLPNITRTQVLNEPYYYTVIELEQGQHEIYAPVGRFSGILWGRGEFDSYAMALGSSLVELGTQDEQRPVYQFTERCGALDGFFRDSMAAGASGMSYATVIWDSTNNYDIKLTQAAPGEDKVKFLATPINKMEDAWLLIEARDRRGNVTYFRYKYDGFRIDAPKEVVFTNVNWNDSTCVDFVVTNNGKRNFNFESYTFKSDPRLSVYFDKTPNIVIHPGEKINVKVCFAPKGNIAEPFQTLTLDLNCDLEITTLVRGSVLGVDLTTRGFDFGEVKIGDTLCGKVGVRIQGNVPVGIDSLLIAGTEPAFLWDTVGQFPKAPNAFADYPIDVCFAPLLRGSVSQSATVANTYSLPHNPIVVKGVGVAPLVEMPSINWGKRRVGSSWDTTITIKNTGNYAGKISFAGFVASDINQEALDALASLNGAEVQKNSNYNYSISFTPPAEASYYAQAKYGVDWKFHDTLYVAAQGIGIIPKIKTNNIDFGDVVINNTRDTLERIVSSLGSEALTIDSIYAGPGDDADFIIDYSALKNLLVDIGRDYKAAITYAPTRFGRSQLQLVVVHDAMPNFARTTDTLTLFGNSIMPATQNISVDITKADFFACNADTIYARVTNNNDFDLTLTGVEITRESGDYVHKALDAAALPYNLKGGAEYAVPIYVAAARGEGGALRVKFIFTENITREITTEITPKEAPVYAAFTKDIEGTPGDTIDVSINGKFPYTVDREKSLTLAINLSHKFLYVLNQDLKLAARSAVGVVNVPFTINRTLDTMYLIIPNIPAGTIDFSITIKCLVLLPEKLTQHLRLQAYSAICYTDSSTNSEINITEVCIFNLRQIEIIANLPSINVAPIPTDNRITIKYTVPEKDDVRFTVYDALGREAVAAFYVKSTVGANEHPLDVRELPAGVYVLNCSSKNLNGNIKFIISK